MSVKFVARFCCRCSFFVFGQVLITEEHASLLVKLVTKRLPKHFQLNFNYCVLLFLVVGVVVVFVFATSNENSLNALATKWLFIAFYSCTL